MIFTEKTKTLLTDELKAGNFLKLWFKTSSNKLKHLTVPKDKTYNEGFWRNLEKKAPEDSESLSHVTVYRPTDFPFGSSVIVFGDKGKIEVLTYAEFIKWVKNNVQKG